MKTALPMKSTVKYPEQYNVKIEAETKETIRRLSDEGVDMAEVCRQALRRAVDEVQSQVLGSVSES